MLKRLFLFLIMNIAVIAVLTLVFTILERVFGITFDLYGFNYTSIFIYSLVIGFSGAFISLFISKWMAKRAYKIKLINGEDLSNLDNKERIIYNIIEDLSTRNNIKIPEIGIYEDNDPNAFATGASKNSALIAVSTGLLDHMGKDEIEGIIGHEMAHILNGDMVTMTLLQGVLNTFVIFLSRILTNLISNFLDEEIGLIVYFVINILLQILLGILASMVAMKFSRYREFKADEGSALFLGKDKIIAGLIALKKFQSIASKDEGNLATMKISTKKSSGFMQLLSSHPNLDKRIENLRLLPN